MPGVSPSNSKTKNRMLGPTVSALDIYDTETVQTHKLGTRLQLGDRVFRYARANATTALATGFLCVGQAAPTLTSTPTALSAGVLVVTLSGALVSTGYYNEGYMVVTNTAGAMGCATTYKIKDTASSISGNFTVTLYDAIASGCATTTSAIVVRSLFDGITKSPITQTECPVGTVLTDVSAGSYCWVQTWGPAGVMSASTHGAGALTRKLVVSASNAGSIDIDMTGCLQPVGYTYANVALATAELVNPIILTLKK